MKMKEYTAGRMDGLLLAQKIVKADGIEALDEEIKFRGATGIHTALARKELDKATEDIKGMTLDTMLVMTVAVLHDEFGYGTKRCQRFIDRMMLKASSMVDNMATWADYQQMIKEELGMELNIRFYEGNR